jgi:hypothetical protein
MSLGMQLEPQKRLHELHDDLESFLWTLVWCLTYYRQVSFNDFRLKSLLDDTFLAVSQNVDGETVTQPAEGKVDFLFGRNLGTIEAWTGTPWSLQIAVHDLRNLFQPLYVDPLVRIKKNFVRKDTGEDTPSDDAVHAWSPPKKDPETPIPTVKLTLVLREPSETELENIRSHSLTLSILQAALRDKENFAWAGDGKAQDFSARYRLAFPSGSSIALYGIKKASDTQPLYPNWTKSSISSSSISKRQISEIASGTHEHVEEGNVQVESRGENADQGATLRRSKRQKHVKKS